MKRPGVGVGLGAGGLSVRKSLIDRVRDVLGPLGSWMLGSEVTLSAGRVNVFHDLVGNPPTQGFLTTGAQRCLPPVANPAFNGQLVALCTGSERYTSSRPPGYFKACHGGVAGGAATVITAFAPSAAVDRVLWATADDVSVYLSSQVGAYHQVKGDPVVGGQQLGWFASNGPAGVPPARVLTGPANILTQMTPNVARQTRLVLDTSAINPWKVHNNNTLIAQGALLGTPSLADPQATMQLFSDTNNPTGFAGSVWTWMFTPKVLSAGELAVIAEFLATGGL